MKERVLKVLTEKERVQDALIEAVRAEIGSGIIPGVAEGSHSEQIITSDRKTFRKGGAA